MKRKIFCALIAALWASTAFAVDGVSFELGRGTHNVDMARFGVQWTSPSRGFAGHRWELARYWDLSFGSWNGGHGAVYDFGLTPVFRLERPGGTPYLDAAIGFHILSDLDVGTGSELSTRFQFGDHIGAGVRFGEHREYDLSLRLQHLSNAGIRNPNPGVNFLQLRFQHHVQ